MLFKIPILVHQISLWLTSLFVRILCNLAFSSVKAVSLHLSIWSSNDLSFFFFFFVKLEILKQPYSDTHALSFFKSRISCYFFQKSLIMIFHQKKKKRKKNPLLLYATAKLGGMDLAYLKSLLKKKKKKSMPRESL